MNPDAFGVEVANGRKPGGALNVGRGQDRNAIWLAQQGEGFDPGGVVIAEYFHQDRQSSRAASVTTNSLTRPRGLRGVRYEMQEGADIQISARA